MTGATRFVSQNTSQLQEAADTAIAILNDRLGIKDGVLVSRVSGEHQRQFVIALKSRAKPDNYLVVMRVYETWPAQQPTYIDAPSDPTSAMPSITPMPAIGVGIEQPGKYTMDVEAYNIPGVGTVPGAKAMLRTPAPQFPSRDKVESAMNAVADALRGRGMNVTVRMLSYVPDRHRDEHGRWHDVRESEPAELWLR